ncbi:MAG: OadG family protein [Paludibacteraceae bacterium]|nr:OadG family protein [Paludibacteraceae bacterium]MBN2788429.1 OadG family protein [Paludibacteraceae bacterium]
MDETISKALLVMLVGMLTVFLILWLITVIGNIIIRLSNKYLPEVEQVVKEKKGEAQQIKKNTYAAIESAVSIVTNGKGKVSEIKKI